MKKTLFFNPQQLTITQIKAARWATPEQGMYGL